MDKITKEELEKILQNHSLWIKGENGGEHADLRDANLSYADLGDANLVGANLVDANLRGVDLRGANLRGANLRGANLVGANLRGANLRDANLRDANLRDANLRDANGNNAEIKTLQLGKYHTVVTVEKITIGCESHSLGEWKNFTDQDIIKMDEKSALAWWKQWQEVIFQVYETFS